MTEAEYLQKRKEIVTYWRPYIQNTIGEAEYLRVRTRRRLELKKLEKAFNLSLQPNSAPVMVPKKSLYLNSFLLGCDPEFAVLDGNNKVKSVAAEIGNRGRIGYDHGGYVVELRPEPSLGAYTLVKNLKKLIEEVEAYPTISPLRFKAGAFAGDEKFRVVDGDRITNDVAVCLGGHIHFEDRKEAKIEQPKDKYDDYGYMQTSSPGNVDRYSTILDTLYSKLLDFDILPKVENSLRIKRHNGAYGHPYSKQHDTIRFKSGHWEYRAFPSWLFHPKVAMLVLTLSKLAVLSGKDSEFHRKLGEISHPKGILPVMEAFKGDRDVDRCLEKLNPEKLIFDPTVDFRDKWKLVTGMEKEG